MITIEQLKDWNDIKARQRLQERIEGYIDETIKRSVLSGNLTIRVSTGYHGRDIHSKSDFYNLWLNKDISQSSLEVVQNRIIEKYKKLGLMVTKERFDEGWHSRYDGLLIVIPDELLEDTDNENKN